jgi:hypothetical protein
MIGFLKTTAQSGIGMYAIEPGLNNLHGSLVTPSSAKLTAAATTHPPAPDRRRTPDSAIPE